MDKLFQGYSKEQIDFINKKLKAAAKSATRTEKKVSALFLEREIDLIRLTWNKTEAPLGISFNDVIIFHINNYLKNGELDRMWNIDLDTLFKKIENLTDYQAFTLIKVALKKDETSLIVREGTTSR